MAADEALREAVAQDFAVGQLLEAVSLAERFLFALVVCESAAVTATLVELLEARLRAGVSWHDPHHDQHDRHKPTPADWLLARVLDPLLRADPSPGAAWVLDATSSLPHDEVAWAVVLQRMNELRNEITQRLHGPLVFCVPEWMEPLVAQNAPDFLSIRTARFHVKAVSAVVVAGDPMRGRSPRSPHPSILAHPSAQAATDEMRDVLRVLSRDPAKALSLAREALLARRAAVAEAPADGVARGEAELGLAQALFVMGQALAACGDHSGALAAYREMIPLLREAARRDPTRSEYTERLAEAWDHVGDLEDKRGDLAEARVAFEQGLDLRRAIMGRAGGDVATQREFERSLRALGDFLTRGGAGGDAQLAARDAWSEAARVLRAMIERDPTHDVWVLDRCELLEKIGHACLALGEPAAAQSAWEECVAALRPLENVRLPRRRRILGRVLVALAVHRPDSVDRAAVLDEAIDVLEGIDDERTTVGVAALESARLREEAGEVEGALARYDRWVALHAGVEGGDDAGELARAFADVQGRIARLRQTGGDVGGAERAWASACAVLRRLPGDGHALIAALLARADVLQVLARHDDAMSCCREVLAVAGEGTSFDEECARALGMLAPMQAASGQKAVAAQSFSSAAKRYERVCATRLNDPEVRRRAVVCLIEAAILYTQLNRITSANKLLRRASTASRDLLALKREKEVRDEGAFYRLLAERVVALELDTGDRGQRDALAAVEGPPLRIGATAVGDVTDNGRHEPPSEPVTAPATPVSKRRELLRPAAICMLLLVAVAAAFLMVRRNAPSAGAALDAATGGNDAALSRDSERTPVSMDDATAANHASDASAADGGTQVVAPSDVWDDANPRPVLQGCWRARDASAREVTLHLEQMPSGRCGELELTIRTPDNPLSATCALTLCAWTRETLAASVTSCARPPDAPPFDRWSERFFYALYPNQRSVLHLRGRSVLEAIRADDLGARRRTLELRRCSDPSPAPVRVAGSGPPDF